MIKIHYDFSDGTEISYIEGLNLKDGFNTHCLDFFTMENSADDVIVCCKDGSYISRNELASNQFDYTEKEIRLAHNIQKMLKAGCFKFKK